MNKTITVDVTMKQLHKYFSKYQIANPTTEDPSEVISNAIGKRYPGADPNDVLRKAEENWLSEDRINMVKDASRNTEKWIDTTVQGDLFDNFPVRVPKWFLIDGEPKEYWKVSIDKAMAYLQVRVAAFRAEAGALYQVADEKEALANSTQKQIENTAKLIQIAKENGIDPATVKYAKKD